MTQVRRRGLLISSSLGSIRIKVGSCGDTTEDSGRYDPSFVTVGQPSRQDLDGFPVPYPGYRFHLNF